MAIEHLPALPSLKTCIMFAKPLKTLLTISRDIHHDANPLKHKSCPTGTIVIALARDCNKLLFFIGITLPYKIGMRLGTIFTIIPQDAT